MDEQSVIENVAPKNLLARKVLIMTGAVVGLILAGGFAYLKTTTSSGEKSESDVSND